MFHVEQSPFPPDLSQMFHVEQSREGGYTPARLAFGPKARILSAGASTRLVN